VSDSIGSKKTNQKNPQPQKAKRGSSSLKSFHSSRLKPSQEGPKSADVGTLHVVITRTMTAAARMPHTVPVVSSSLKIYVKMF